MPGLPHELRNYSVPHVRGKQPHCQLERSVWSLFTRSHRLVCRALPNALHLADAVRFTRALLAFPLRFAELRPDNPPQFEHARRAFFTSWDSP